MGKVGTTGGILWDLGQFSGSIAGAWLAVKAPKLSLYASAVCALGTIGLFSTLKEPLAVDKRKPFRMLEANPIGSLGLLFSCNHIPVLCTSTITIHINDGHVDQLQAYLLMNIPATTSCHVLITAWLLLLCCRRLGPQAADSDDLTTVHTV